MPDDQNDETSRIGRPREVSDKEILETGRGLANEGLTVSGSRLRGRIRRGNPYTLKRRWDELQADQTTGDSASEPEMPEALIELHGQIRDSVDAQLHKAIKRAFDEAHAVWQARLQEERHQLDLQRNFVHEEWVDTSEYYDELDLEREAAEKKTAQAEQEALDAYKELRTVQDQLTAETARADAAERQVSELQAEVCAWCERAARAEEQIAQEPRKTSQKSDRPERAKADKKQARRRNPKRSQAAAAKQARSKTNERTNKPTL